MNLDGAYAHIRKWTRQQLADGSGYYSIAQCNAMYNGAVIEDIQNLNDGTYNVKVMGEWYMYVPGKAKAWYRNPV